MNDLKRLFPFLRRSDTKHLFKERLQLVISASAVSANPVRLSGFTRNGMIHQLVTPTADGEPASVTLGLDDIPIMLGVTDDGNAFRQGDCWVSVELHIGGKPVAGLCSGQVYAEKGISYPTTRQDDAIPGRGAFATVNSNNPAAGAEALITVPDGELWKVLYGSGILVTDANAADRRVHFVFTNAGGVVIDTFNTQNQTASQTRKHSAAHFGGSTDNGDDNDFSIELPTELFLDGESTITTDVTNLQVGDDWGIVKFMVEKFPGW